MTTNQNSTEILRDEILAEARREAEDIVKRARQDAEIIITRAAAEADKIRQERLDQAHADASHQSELIVATVPVEAGRLRSERIDALLESVHEEAFQRLLVREGFEYREMLISLAAYAVSRMAGAAFVVRLSDEDQAIISGDLVNDITQQVGRPVHIDISHETMIIGGGVVIEDTEGRQVWDNSLTKRLERLWPELRRQIAVQAAFVPKGRSGGQSP